METKRKDGNRIFTTKENALIAASMLQMHFASNGFPTSLRTYNAGNEVELTIHFTSQVVSIGWPKIPSNYPHSSHEYYSAEYYFDSDKKRHRVRTLRIYFEHLV